MPGNDPPVQAGVSSGQQASALGAAQILQKQTGEPPVAERNWFERVVANYRPPTGICLFPFPLASTARSFSSGQMFGAYWAPDSEQRQRLPTISTIEALQGVAGAAVTLAKMGIYDYATSAKLAETADFSSATMTGALAHTRALLTPLPMPSKPFWVTLLVVFTTTTPQFCVMNTPASVGASTTPFVGSQQASLADLPATMTPAGSTIVPWFGLF